MSENNNSLDLRLVIGLFFLVVSIILFVTSFIVKNGDEVNRYTAIAFFVFAITMLALSKKK